jgi:hypothetical protein
MPGQFELIMKIARYRALPVLLPGLARRLPDVGRTQ